jgi:L-threonylcarbamoyladenylate synthase
LPHEPGEERDARAEAETGAVVVAGLSGADARRLEECLAAGGVALIPTDTVYGLACDPRDERAVRRLYELKGRPPQRPSAVMFFSLQGALEALPELGPSEQEVIRALLPGPLTVLLRNAARRFPLACGPRPETLGLRVPLLSGRIAALAALARPTLQSSANLSGGPEARRLREISPQLRRAADIALDGGELPGVASTVLDLSSYERDRSWRVVRAGPVGRRELERVLC